MERIVTCLDDDYVKISWVRSSDETVLLYIVDGTSLSPDRLIEWGG